MTQFLPATLSDARRMAQAPATAVLLSAMLSLPGCDRPPPPTSSDTAALSACRRRADEVYAKQNRAELYTTDTFTTSGRDSPYSTSDLPSVPTRGLSGQYERDNLVSQCLDGTGAATGVSTAAPRAPSAPAPGTPTASQP